MQTQRTYRRRGFALTDLAATLVVSGVLIALAGAGLSETRRQAQLDESIANLKRFGAATKAYAADYEGHLWGLSWQGGTQQMMVQENGDVELVQLPDNDLDAQAWQAVHLMRLLDDRVGEHAMPIINNWIANVLYSHLPLVDYLGEHPLDRWTADPGDRIRLNWKDDPINKFDDGFWLPLQPDPTPVNRRWPYSSSYLTVPATWDENQSDLKNGLGLRLQYVSQYGFVSVPVGHELFGLRLADVAFPGSKVHVTDEMQRHFGPCQPLFLEEHARVPLLFFDGAVRVRATNESNPGWKPNSPMFPCTIVVYQPQDWLPPTCPLDPQIVKGHYYWTRGGLKGIDFDGLPLDTGQKNLGECDF